MKDGASEAVAQHMHQLRTRESLASAEHGALRESKHEQDFLTWSEACWLGCANCALNGTFDARYVIVALLLDGGPW